jgi:CheY-like chemotaxis protein
VTVHTDSNEALHAFGKHPDGFDLVVSDYSMPHMVASETRRAICGIRRDIPILMITGLVEDLPDELLPGLGVRRTLKKPVTTHELAIAIHEVLSGTP